MPEEIHDTNEMTSEEIRKDQIRKLIADDIRSLLITLILSALAAFIIFYLVTSIGDYGIITYVFDAALLVVGTVFIYAIWNALVDVIRANLREIKLLKRDDGVKDLSDELDYTRPEFDISRLVAGCVSAAVIVTVLSLSVSYNLKQSDTSGFTSYHSTKSSHQKSTAKSETAYSTEQPFSNTMKKRSKHKTEDDPFDTNDFYSAEDFYYEYLYDFSDYFDAEDYYNEHYAGG